MGLTLTPGKVAWDSSREHAVPVRRKELRQGEKYYGLVTETPSAILRRRKTGGFIFGDNI